jgi:Tail-tube assembly protein
MPLFSLTDIIFSDKSARGPLSELSSSPFQLNTYRYPIDLGNYDKGHYIVIYARQQKGTKYKSYNGGLYSPSGDISASTTGATFKTPDIKSAISGNPSETQNSVGNQINQITGASRTGGYLNKTEMTTDAIALYMPDTLMYQYNQTYSDVSLTDTMTGQMMAAGQSTIDAENKFSVFLSSVLKSIGSKFAQNKIGGGIGTAALFAATGQVVNPMLEMIYRSPSFRTFQFDFMFYPRDTTEALEVQKIMERLRFHQAPEISSTVKGDKEYGFLIPPSEFEIRFYYNGQQNPNIPPIATVVLENIQINYAPNGFSAYEVAGQNLPSLGKTGMPVATQMTLQFKEVTYLTKDDYKLYREEGDQLLATNSE